MSFLAILWPVLGPALLTIPLDGRPVRFGAALPAAAVAGGLRLQGRGTLQWRRLPVGGPTPDPVWVELAIVGPPGTVRLLTGGDGPTPDGRGAAFVREEEERTLAGGVERTVRWRWSDGAVDERTRVAFTAAAVLRGETFAAGEFLTATTPELGARADVVCRLPRAFAVGVGLLPERGGGGATTRGLRTHLAAVVPLLPPAPGERGRGDFVRSGGVVTNLEFDTTLALLRCALAEGAPAVLHRARAAAQHLVDRDLDGHSGLPFAHGPEHRAGSPEPGHAWVTGLLWVGLLTADDELLAAAHAIGHAFASQPPRGTGRNERLRDYAWPLLELEALLAVGPDRGLARAADLCALSIARRFDPVARTFRFGEGEVGAGIYFERAWLTGGVLLPALRAHLRRRPDAALAAAVAQVERALLDRIGANAAGLPTHWRVAGGTVFAEHREERTAEVAFLLDGLSPDELPRLLRRSTVRRALGEFPPRDHPDLATQWTLLARCTWPWR